MKRCFLVLLVVAVLCCGQTAAQNMLGLAGPPTGSHQTPEGSVIYPLEPITFSVFLQTSGAGGNIIRLSNGWALYLAASPGDASAALPTRPAAPTVQVADLLPYFPAQPPLIYTDPTYHVIGITRSAYGPYPGFPPGYNLSPYLNITTQVGITDVGKYLCLDSIFYPPAGVWLWGEEYADFWPAWNGPFCFEIVDCCELRGDLNGDGIVDIRDLIGLINALFRQGQLDCTTEADTNGDGQLSVADLTTLIGYLFRGGSAPVLC